MSLTGDLMEWLFVLTLVLTLFGLNFVSGSKDGDGWARGPLLISVVSVSISAAVVTDRQIQYINHFTY